MADPVCEISPNEKPISNCAVGYTVERSQDGTVSPIRDSERTGSAWGKAVEHGHHISVDGEMIRTYQSVAGESLMLKHPF